MNHPNRGTIADSGDHIAVGLFGGVFTDHYAYERTLERPCLRAIVH